MTRHNVIQIKGMYLFGANMPLLNHLSGYKTLSIVKGSWHFSALSQCLEICVCEVMLIQNF